MVTLPDKSYSRVIIVQILYILNLSSTEIKDLTEESIEEHIQQIKGFYNSAHSDESELIAVMRDKAKHKFIRSVLMGLSHNIETIDETIIKNLSRNDSWSRMHILIKSLLRASIAEYISVNTARKILIDEYVSITNSFFAVKETSFVNATLDKVIQDFSNN
jgi:transcription antitermination factor NusB